MASATFGLEQMTRADVIRTVTRAACDAGAAVINRFAPAVCERYLELTPVSARTLPIRKPCETDVDRYEADRVANLRYVQRLLSGEGKTFPADIEDAWIDSLPEPFRGDLDRALSARRGFLATRAPTAGGHAANLAEALTRAGETTLALAPIFDDGAIGVEDLPYLARALDALNAQQASLSSIREQILRVFALAGGTTEQRAPA